MQTAPIGLHGPNQFQQGETLDDCPEASAQLLRELHQAQVAESLQRMGSRQIISVSIVPTYVRNWDGKAAFRELYQNWEAKRALGFIKYDKKCGRVTLTNANAQLPIEALEVGWSTKTGQTGVGGSGEGLKLAALTLSRDGLRVRIAASRCNWLFSIEGVPQPRLCCTVRPSTKCDLFEGADPAADMAQLHSRIARDVTVTVGSTGTGHPPSVTQEMFLDWLQITMEIRGLNFPSTVIQTPSGDIILDVRYAGMTYLDGMFVSTAGSKLQGYKLGYNFARGTLSRDRLWLVSQHEEANMVRQMWEFAIEQHGTKLLPIYVSLLQYFPETADVAMADRLLEQSTKRLMWKHLKSYAGKEFFYDARSALPVAAMIKEHLGKKPTKLPGILWDLLRSAAPIQTFEEAQSSAFQNAVLTEDPKCSFGRTVARAVRACMALLSTTRKIQVTFAQMPPGASDLHYDRQNHVLKIHARWLEFDSIHKGSPCQTRFPAAMSGQNAPFFCGHVVEELMQLAVKSIFQIPIALTTTERRYTRHIRRLLASMPHSIKLSSIKPVGLLVTWNDNAPHALQKMGANAKEFHIVLHEDRCRGQQHQLLHQRTGRSRPSSEL
ncbi:hypothetical protein N7540_013036 [Penicillium herquei]|nr:hypothetical protein N7540_013036 [Penicillium herquei]